MQLAEAQLELEYIMLHKVRQEEKDRYRMNSNMWAMKIHSKGVLELWVKGWVLKEKSVGILGGRGLHW